MFVDNNFIADENAKRLSLGIAGAVFTHALVLLWFSSPQSAIISADTFSPPTNVSIRFVTPVKKAIKKQQSEPVVEVVKAEPVKKKPVVQKTVKVAAKRLIPQEFNKIEPAAAPSQTYKPTPQPVQQEPVEISKPVRDTIPVVSDAHVKGRRVQPEYPKRALRMRQEGVVWLRVLIGKDGERQQIRLHKPSQHALLNQAALRAVQKWTFDPNVVNGRAIQSWVEIPIEFKIQ